MPSKLPKVNFVLDDDELALVKQYQKDNNIRSLSKAFVELVAKGLANEESKIASQEAAAKIEQPAKDDGLSKEADRMVRLLRDVPEDQRELAVDLVESVLLAVLRHAPVLGETQVSFPAGSGR